MKKPTRILLTVIVAAVLVITAVSSVFGYIAMTEDFDHQLCYFNAGSVYGSLYILLPIIASAISVICGIMLRKKVSFIKAPSANIPTVFTSVLTGLLMFASAIITYTNSSELSKISTAAVIFAIVAGIYFVLLPFMGEKPFMAFLSFAPALWATFKLLEEYFRQGEPLNSPIKTVSLTMFAFLLLFFAEEIRFGFDRQIPGTYYFCILSAVAFTGNAVLPKLAIILTGDSIFEFFIIDWCLGAAVLLFLLARLSAIPAVLGEYKENKETDTEPEEN